MRSRLTSSRPFSRLLVGAGAATTLLLATSGCAGISVSDSDDSATSGADGASSGATQAAQQKQSAATVTANIAQRATGVKVDRTYRVSVAQGTLDRFSVTSAGQPLAGALSADKTSWASTAKLQPGKTYLVRGAATDSEGLLKVYNTRFTTQSLSLDQQTFPSFVPTGGTVGVGMPVMIKFDVPVTDRAAIQRHLSVVTQPAQAGSFHWISDQEVHWRPQSYWQPGTKVTVNANIGSVAAGNGVYGQKDRTTSFTVGRSMVSKVDAGTDQMKVFRNGQLVRTIPITTGKPGFTTRSGVKVIVEKFRHKRMNSETIGIDPNSANGYDLDDVEYAMRLTYSGEFLHAAPWSVASQGNSNVSHGCTGMSTANARWLYENSMPGDVVEYTGTDKPMTLTNGYGDWNESFAQYQTGSAAAS